MSGPAKELIVCNCGVQFKHFCSYKKHFLKMKCKPEQSISQSELMSTLQESELETFPLLESTINNTQQDQTEINEPAQRKVFKFNQENVERMLANRNKAICDYCNKRFVRNNLARHRQLHCKHRYKALWEYEQLVKHGIQNIPETPIEVKELYYKLSANNQLPKPNTTSQPTTNIGQQIVNNNNTQNNAVETLNQTINQTVNQTINNNVNNNITQNIIQNNIVIIQPIMHEDLSHITKEEQQEIILLKAHAFKRLLDYVYANRKNHNVAFTDKPSKKKVKFLDKKYGITNGGAYDKLGDISMQHLAYLDGYIQAHKDALPEKYKKDIKFLEDFITNEANNDELIAQFFDKVDCISNSSKELLDLHDKQKINEFVTGLIKEKQLAAIEVQSKNDALLLAPQLSNIPINIAVTE